MFSCRIKRQGRESCSCYTELSIKVILLINVKMPTSDDILTLISRIFATSSRFRHEKYSLFQYFFLIMGKPFYDFGARLSNWCPVIVPIRDR